MVGIQIREWVVQVAGGTDRCHQFRIFSDNFVQVAEDDDVTANILFLLNSKFEVVDALLPWVWVFLAGKTEELPLLGEYGGWAYF